MTAVGARALVATLVLLALTGVTAALFERGASGAMILAVSVVKIIVVGAVFLELDRLRRSWRLGAVGLVVLLAGGLQLLMGHAR